MTETEMAHVEARLGPLPAEFRRFLLTAPPADRADLGSGAYHVGQLIKENARVRHRPADHSVQRADGTEHP